MRTFCRGWIAALLLTVGVGAYANPTLSGEYIEARTLNVYTGACHANGESVTAGREAMMIWNVQNGAYNGVELGGVRAMAVVAGDGNLAWGSANRRAVLYVDEKATDAQRAAIVAALKERYASQMGPVIGVKTAPIEFSRNGLEYTIRVPNVAYLKTTRYGCEHCVMPHMVWYEPFIPLKSSLVAKASLSEFKGVSELGVNWRRADENSSYVGEFSF
jgi:hypothetical protein